MQLEDAKRVGSSLLDTESRHVSPHVFRDQDLSLTDLADLQEVWCHVQVHPPRQEGHRLHQSVLLRPLSGDVRRRQGHPIHGLKLV